jgi:muconate cycloisomerase
MIESKMKIESCELFFLKIPLRFGFSHGAKADRKYSDSIIVKLHSADMDGYGEAVVRDYVSGSLEAGVDYRQHATRVVSRLVAPIEGRFLSWSEMNHSLDDLACDSRELPFLCAVQTALLDLACKWNGRDIYSLLGQTPRREIIQYGGVLPFFPMKEAEKYLRFCRELGLPNIKVKLNGDPDFSSSILGLTRDVLGESFEIRVDANSSWAVDDGRKLFDVCRRFGVTVVEQPFEDSTPGASELMREAQADGFMIMADERVLLSQDLQLLAEAGTYSAVNLRLSKNGGLSRVLTLAEEVTKTGLSYQLGCMVGETGILSALGRAAAALLPASLFAEGSYDDIILTENITTRSMGFGPGGAAPIIREQGVGYAVSTEKLARLSVARVACS